MPGTPTAAAWRLSSWIDFDDGMMGCLATDSTRAENVHGLCMLIRDAAPRSVRESPICAADFNRDGDVDGSDVAASFFARERGRDLADVSEYGGNDSAAIEAFFSVREVGVC